MYPTVRENPFTCSEYVDYCTVGLFYLVPFVEEKYKLLSLPQNDKCQNGKECKGKTIYAQSTLARRVRQNVLADRRLTSSPPLPPPPYTLWRTHRPLQ